MPSARRWPTAFIILCGILAALALRLAAGVWQPLSVDEWFTLNSLAGDVPALIRERLAASHSPLYFLLLKAAGLTAQSSDAALRIPSAIIDSLGIGLLTWIAAKTSGRFAVFAFLVMACLSPALLTHGHTARPYALLYFCLALALAGAVTAIRVPRVTVSAFGVGARHGPAQRTTRIAIAAMAVGLVGAGYTQNLGVIAAALMPAAIIFLPACRRNRRFLRLWLVVHALVWLALLPNLIALAPTVQALTGHYWVEMASSSSLKSLRFVVTNTYGFFFSGDRNRFLPAGFEIGVGIAVACLACVSLVVHRHRATARLIAFAAFALPLAVLAMSAVQSLLIPRYFIVALPAFFLLAADGAAILAKLLAGRMIALVILAGVALQGLDATVDQRVLDWRMAVRFLDMNSYGVVRGVANTPLEKGMVERHAAPGLAVDLTLETDPRLAGERLAALLRTEPFVWLFEGWRPDQPGPDISAYVACSWLFGQSKIFILARDRANLPAAIRACGPQNGYLQDELRRVLYPAP